MLLSSFADDGWKAAMFSANVKLSKVGQAMAAVIATLLLAWLAYCRFAVVQQQLRL